jgi:hypothetical protein
VALRLALLAAAAGGSLLLSPALRTDLLEVWRARLRAPSLPRRL